MVKIFTSRWSIGRFCNGYWLLSSGLKLHKNRDDQDVEWFYAQKGKDVNLNENSFECSFLLGGWGSNQGWSFPFVRG
jgi:hypothetical protein